MLKNPMGPAVERALARLDEQRKKEAMKKRARRVAVKARPVGERPKGRPVHLNKILPLAGWKVLVARMEPGTWYGMLELRALAPEYRRGSFKAWIKLKLLAGGFVERAGNPDFDHSKPGGSQTESRYLHRLSGKGAAAAQDWRKALGMTSDPSDG
jgi:hypothetical protein